MRGLLCLTAWLDRLAEVLGRVASIFPPVMVLVTCYIVVTRYLLNTGSVAVQDVVAYCNSLIFAIGAGYTLKHDGHVRVDVFYSAATARTKALVNLLGSLLFLLPVVIFVLWICWQYVATAWAIREGSPDTGGLPYVYLLKSLILVMGGVLICQGLAELLRNVQRLLEPAVPAAQANAAPDNAGLP